MQLLEICLQFCLPNLGWLILPVDAVKYIAVYMAVYIAMKAGR